MSNDHSVSPFVSECRLEDVDNKWCREGSVETFYLPGSYPTLPYPRTLQILPHLLTLRS